MSREKEFGGRDNKKHPKRKLIVGYNVYTATKDSREIEAGAAQCIPQTCKP